jgi:hypothetical protein
MGNGFSMRMFGGTALLFAVLPGMACVSQSGKAENSGTSTGPAARLATLSIELGSLEQRLDGGADLALESSIGTFEQEMGRNATEQEKDQVRAIFRSVLGEFLTPKVWEASLTKVYVAHFSAAEIEELIQFYDSPVGRKVLELDVVLSRELDNAIEEVLDPKMAEFIDRVDEEIEATFGDLNGAGS